MFSASDAMVRLLTTPKVFPKVVDILGSNLFLYHGYLVGDRAAPPGDGMSTGLASVAAGRKAEVGRSVAGRVIPPPR